MKKNLGIIILIAMMFLIFDFNTSIVPTTAFSDDAVCNNSNDVLVNEIMEIDHRAIYEETGNYMENLGTPDVGSVGGEWMVICLTRSGRICPDEYYENVINYIEKNINDKNQLHRSKSTDNSRVILALTSLGYNAANVDDYNLIAGLSDMNYLKKQGVNGPIWALIALDSHNYEIPKNSDVQTQATREEIIAYILEKQLPDGGWSIFGNVADPDMTGMALQALAPYCSENPKVVSSVERALNCLSDIQHENGSFGSIDGSCTESCAQVIVALTSLGIDPENDERFVKNGISVVDAMCGFAVEGGGFEHTFGSGLNGMATEQGQYALVSYFRFLDGNTSLYDMTDVTIEINEDFESESNDTAIEEDYIEEDYTEDEEYFENYVSDALQDGSYSDVADDSKPNQTDVSTKDEDIKDVINEIAKNSDNQSEDTTKIVFTQDIYGDVGKEDWYYESVKYVYENSLMEGTEKSIFAPCDKMTRAMLVTVLFRMENPGNETYTHSFSDVPGDMWYTNAIAWANSNKIVSGIDENNFAPNEDITREQIVLIIYRYAKMKSFDMDNVSNLENFTDTEDISYWAIDAMKWASFAELITGTGETTLSPNDSVTRAQCATILMRLEKLLTNNQGK